MLYNIEGIPDLNPQIRGEDTMFAGVRASCKQWELIMIDTGVFAYFFPDFLLLQPLKLWEIFIPHPFFETTRQGPLSPSQPTIGKASCNYNFPPTQIRAVQLAKALPSMLKYAQKRNEVIQALFGLEPAEKRTLTKPQRGRISA